MGHHRLTYKEQRILEDLLRSRLTIIGEGHCKYNGMGSDDHVAAEARMKGIDGCNKSHVRYVRREMFGELRAEKPSNGEVRAPGVVLDQLQDHERVLKKLRDDLNLVMDYLTRTEGVNWTMEDFRFGLRKPTPLDPKGDKSFKGPDGA